MEKEKNKKKKKSQQKKDDNEQEIDQEKLKIALEKEERNNKMSQGEIDDRKRRYNSKYEDGPITNEELEAYHMKRYVNIAWSRSFRVLTFVYSLGNAPKTQWLNLWTRNKQMFACVYMFCVYIFHRNTYSKVDFH